MTALLAAVFCLAGIGLCILRHAVWGTLCLAIALVTLIVSAGG